MNSSLEFRFGRVPLATALFGLVAGACLSGTATNPGAPKCTTNSDCAVGLECSAGQCLPTQTPNGGGQGGSAAPTSMGGNSGVPAAGSGGPSQTGSTSDLVDDLEDNDARIIQTEGRQGSWYAFSDGTITPSAPDDNGNTNGFMPGSPGANGSQHAAHVQASGFPTYAGVAVDFNNAGVRPKDTVNRKTYDVSGYDGVVFYAKGTSSGQMRLLAVTKEIAGTSEGGTCDDSNTANHCWDSYGQDFSLQSDWAELRIRFSDMTTDNSSPFDPTQVFGLALQDNAQNGSLDLWIDDLALFKDGGGVSPGGGSTGSPTSGGGTATGGGSPASGGSTGTGGGSPASGGSTATGGRSANGGSGNSGNSGGMSMGGSGPAAPTSCTLSGSANPGSGSFTWYYFGQGTAKQNGLYKTACGYTGTESGKTDTVSNIVSPKYFAAIPGKSGFDTVGHCGECVKISNGGKSIVATVIDECPTDNGQNPACTSNHLDLSWQAWNDLSYSVGNPSGTTWQFEPCPISGNVQLSFNGPNEVYVQNMIVPIQSVQMAGASSKHTSYGSWQFGSAVQGKSLTITDVAGRIITVTANAGDSGAQFPGCK